MNEFPAGYEGSDDFKVLAIELFAGERTFVFDGEDYGETLARNLMHTEADVGRDMNDVD